MKNWLKTHRLPILVACFVLGLLVADQFSPPFYFLFTFVVLFACLSLFSKRVLWAGLLFIFLGCLHSELQFPKNEATFRATPGSYQLTITGPLHFTRQGVTATAEIDSGGKRIPTRLIVYEGVPEILSGDVVRVWGRIVPVRGFRNPGAPDPVRQEERQGIFWTTRVSRAEAVVPVGRSPTWWPIRFMERWRYSLRRDLMVRGSDSTYALIRGITLGDRSGLSTEVRDDFRRSGLAHLLAISGQHVGLVAVIFFLLFRGILSLIPRVGLTIPLSKLAWILAWFPSSLYVSLAGFPISAVRAWILLSCLVLAVLLHRTRQLFSALAAAALVILVANPAALFEVSFQLSFVAAAALILFFEGRRGWRRLLLASIVVVAATAPMVAYYFSQIALGGILANLVAIPYLGFVFLPLSIFSVLLLPLWTAGATWLLGIAGVAAEGLLQVAHWTAAIGGTISIGLKPAQVGFCYLAFGVGFLFSGKWWRKLSIAVFSLFVLLGGEYLYTKIQQEGVLSLTLLDVGQGEAISIRFPDRSYFLVDGGGFYIPKEKRDFEVADPGERVLVPYFKRQGVSNLEGVVLTHPDPDHSGGLTKVIRQFSPRHFFWNGDLSPGEDFATLLSELHSQGIPQIKIDEQTDPLIHAGVRIEWLNPPATMSRLSRNDRSIVMRLTYGTTCFLLTGDIEALTEGRMTEAHDLSCDVLKVPHHLSRTSSGQEFLQVVAPTYAIASLGVSNPFGFPAPEVLERYRRQGITVLRTDRHGAITVESDGQNINVKTVVPR